MDLNVEVGRVRQPPATTHEKILTLAAMAVGGQGGGVLTNWITQVAEANGYVAQSTSVAGVAQRTGATIYYVEMCRDTGKLPIFSLSACEGDVDILIAAELMEAGRAVVRGFITPGRTTVIASTHRIASVSEKMQPGDGRADSDVVARALGVTADRLVAFDLERIARDAGSVISSSLLGALAGSRALPFKRSSYEDVIRASGYGVDASLRAFAVAYAKAKLGEPLEKETAVSPSVRDFVVPDTQVQHWDQLVQRLNHLPEAVKELGQIALAKVVDYQDMAYGSEFVERLERVVALDAAPYKLSVAAAKYIAKAMCYDDIIRVADLKTRASRMQQVRVEMQARDDQVMQVVEYFHPRLEEFLSTLPSAVAGWITRRKRFSRWLGKRLDKGRRIRSDGLIGFCMLWTVSLLRPWRRRLLRHQNETRHFDAWMNLVCDTAKTDRALATEILSTHRLIKGYSDTHARGLSKFDTVIGAVALLQERPDAADWLRRLRTCALQDVEGKALERLLIELRSLPG